MTRRAWPPRSEAKLFLGLSLGVLGLIVAVMAYHGFAPMIVKSVALYAILFVALAARCIWRLRQPDDPDSDTRG